MGLKRRLKGGDFNNGYNSNSSISSVKSGLKKVRSIENLDKERNRARRSSISSIGSKDDDFALIKQLFDKTNILNNFDDLNNYINDTYETERDFYNSIKNYLSKRFESVKSSENEIIIFKQKYMNLISILNYYKDLPNNIKQYFMRIGNSDFGGEYQDGGLKRKTRKRKTYRSKSLRKKKD